MIFFTVCKPSRIQKPESYSLYLYFNLYDILANYLDLNAMKKMRNFHCLPTYYSVFISLCWTSTFHVTCIKKWNETCFVVMTLKMYIVHTTKCMIYVLFYMVFGRVIQIIKCTYPIYNPIMHREIISLLCLFYLNHCHALWHLFQIFRFSYIAFVIFAHKQIAFTVHT